MVFFMFMSNALVSYYYFALNVVAECHATITFHTFFTGNRENNVVTK